MSPEIIAIVVGLVAAWVPDFLVKDRGYGMTADLGWAFGHHGVIGQNISDIDMPAT
jgi:hypothetical protein